MKTPYYDTAAPKVGDLVYMNGSPVQAGKIIAVLDRNVPGEQRNMFRLFIRVRQPNGKEWEDVAHVARCFRTLVEDHERKAAKGRATIELLAVIPAGDKLAAGTWIVVRAGTGNEYGKKSADTGYGLQLPPVGTKLLRCKWEGDDVVPTGETMIFTQKIADAYATRL